MRPLPCAAGWTKMDPSNPSQRAILNSFLEAEFGAAQRQLQKARSPAYCAAGVESASYSGYFLACQSGANVQAQGVVTYVCNGSSKKLQLGLNAEGTYTC